MNAITLIKTFSLSLVFETAKIYGSVNFLKYISKQFLTNPKICPWKEVYEITILGPLFEEVVFRGCLLRGYFISQMSRLYEGITDRIIDRINESDRISIKRQLKIDRLSLNRQKVIDKIIRIQTNAFLFAAAHLSNHHESSFGKLFQFSWSYFGGLGYAYMSEKYKTLAVSILIHGFNNFLAVAIAFYPTHFYSLLTILYVNKIAAYYLGTKSNEDDITTESLKKIEHYNKVNVQ